jgi:hypothetical protein
LRPCKSWLGGGDETGGLALATVVAFGAAAWAADPDYQRYDLVRESSELTLEASVSYEAQNVNARNMHTLGFGAAAEYVFKTNHSVSLALPYTMAVYDDPDARQTLFYAPGNIRLGYDYRFRFNHLNLFTGPLAAISLTENNEYSLREGVLAAGSGRHSVGARVSLTGVRDPVVWNVDVQYLIGLPKTERFYTSWQPGNIQVSAGFSHLSNYRFGLGLALTQRLNLPALLDGQWDPAGVSVSTLGKGEFFILFEKDYVRMSAETSLYPINQPAAIGLVYGHAFDASRKSGRK